MGTSTEYAIQSLCKGIGRQSKLILDNIGIVFAKKAAYQWFKNQSDKETLTDTEKRIAWKSYAIQLILEKAEMLTITKKKKLKLNSYTRNIRMQGKVWRNGAIK